MTKNKISAKKLFIMLSTELFAMTSLILPSVLVGFAGKNGLLVLLASSGLLLLTAVWYLNCIGEKKYSLDHAVVQQENLLLRRGIKGIYILRYFIHGAFLMVIFVNLIQEVLLPNYSFFWILVPILLLAYLTAGKQLRVRGRILEVLFPYIFLPLLVVLFLALFQVDYSALPSQLWNVENGTGEQSMLYGVYGTLMFYQPIEFLLFLVPALSEQKASYEKKRKLGQDDRTAKRRTNAKESSVTGAACIFAIVINVIMYVAAIGMFGTVRTGGKLWSALYIMQSVRLPGRFVERLDILFLVFWIFSTFALFSAYLYYGSRFVVTEESNEVRTIPPRTDSENKKIQMNGRWYTCLWLAGILIVTLCVREPRRMFELFVPYKMWVDFPLSLLLPLFLYKKERKKGVKRGQMVALLTTLCIFTLTGCQDRVDIEDKNYVMTIGVEKGEEKPFKIHYEIAGLSSTSQEGGERKPENLIYEASSLKEAEELDIDRDDKKLDFGHLKAIVISMELTEAEESWKALTKELDKKDSIAGTTLLFFTEEKVESLIGLGGEKSSSFGEYVDKMTENQKKENGEEDTLARWLRDQAEGIGKRPIRTLKTEGEQLVLGNDTLSNVNPDIVRFHIRAESDSEEDQNRKIKVKDRILPKLQELLKNADSKEGTLDILTRSLGLVNQWVQEACDALGYQCETNAYLCRESFPLKNYGDIIVPSGTYDALRIDLGKAEGANWWCMMYPSLCMMEDVTGQVEEDKASITAEDSNKEKESGMKEGLMSSNGKKTEWEGIFQIRKKNNYQIRFKAAEWFSELWERWHFPDGKDENSTQKEKTHLEKTEQ